MSKVNAGILGTGHSYPEGILTNADLEKMAPAFCMDYGWRTQ